MIKMVILDLYGTIARINDNRPRNGLSEFMDRYNDKKYVVATDADRKDAEKTIEDLGIRKRLSGIYIFDEMVEYEGTRIKDLNKIADENHVDLDDCVFISDSQNGMDQLAASIYNVRFIRVPYYMRFNEEFSFSQINLDT